MNFQRNISLILLAIENGSARLSFLPLNEEILVNFGYTLAQAKLIQGEFDEDSQTYHNNLDYVPEEDKESLFKYASKWFVDHYEEKNNYYRLLNGQPEYSKDNNYFIYITIRIHFSAKVCKNPFFNTTIYYSPTNNIPIL